MLLLKVTVRGPKEDVKKACQQLQELTTERQLSSYSAEVRAKPQHHKFLIGKNGANIKKIRDLTGARIVFPTDKDENKDVITITGKQKAVELAKAELEATIKEIVSSRRRAIMCRKEVYIYNRINNSIIVGSFCCLHVRCIYQIHRSKN